MEVDAPAEAESGGAVNGVMASPGTTGSVNVALHPLVIMNISEHWTRVKAQEGKPMQVLGAVIGQQKGRKIEIMNSIELLFDIVEGEIVIDMSYYELKEGQFKQVFSEMDFLGWYSTGDGASESDIKIHKQFFPINESPVFLQLNPASRTSDLPISLFESVIDIVKGDAKVLFVDIPYTLASEEAERIGVDHVARVSAADTADSSTAEHLVAQHSSIKMLHNRVKIILSYIQAAEKGEVAKNHEILREAYSLCHRLPVFNSNRFGEDYYTQCNDVCLMAYLGAMTKGTNTMNQFLNKFNVLYDKGMSRRVRGLFF